MRRVKYDDIVRTACIYCGLDPDNLSTDEWRLLRDAISSGIERFWLQYEWPSLTRIKRLAFGETYDPTRAYALGQVVWHPDSGQHYVTLNAAPATTPATYNSVTDEWDTDTANWFRCIDIPEPEAADEWRPGTAYAVGDTVAWGAGVYACKVATTGSESPENTSYWTQLPNPWRIIRAYQYGRDSIGNILVVSDRDPRRRDNAYSGVFWQHEDGWVVSGLKSQTPWVWYQIAPPRLYGEMWDPTVSYPQEDITESIYGMSPEEEIQPSSQDYSHYADRTDLSIDSGLPTADYYATA